MGTKIQKTLYLCATKRSNNEKNVFPLSEVHKAYDAHNVVEG